MLAQKITFSEDRVLLNEKQAMTVVYRIEEKQEYLYLVGEGIEGGLEENQRIHQMILNLCRKHNCHRVLIDDQKVIYTASICSIFYLAEYYARVAIPRTIRRAAVVANPEYEVRNMFFETVARNRGIDLRVFYDPEEAEAWLLKE